MTDAYFVLHFLGTVPPVGRQTVLAHPHVTFLQQTVAGDEADAKFFARAVKDLAHDTEPFELEVREEALFGENKDLPVRVFKKSYEAEHLHSNLVRSSMLAAMDQAKPEFSNSNFTAHMTLVPGLDLPSVGESIKVDSISLVKFAGGVDEGSPEILATYKLHGSTDGETLIDALARYRS